MSFHQKENIHVLLSATKLSKLAKSAARLLPLLFDGCCLWVCISLFQAFLNDSSPTIAFSFPSKMMKVFAC